MTILIHSSSGSKPKRSPLATATSSFETTFDSLYSGWTPVSNTTNYSRPAQADPSKATTTATPGYTDSNFGTKIYKATDVPTDVSGSPTHLRHFYSKIPVFNCDSSKYLVLASDSYLHVYNASTFAHIDGGRASGSGTAIGSLLGVTGSDCDPMWHPTDPDKLWYTADLGGLLWYELTISTGVSTTLFNFTGRLSAIGMSTGAKVFMGGEGRCSDDGRYWCFMVKTSGDSMVGLFDYDRQTDTILSSIATSNTPNWVGMSHDGAYSVIGWHNFSGSSYATTAGQGTTVADGTRAYPRGGLAGPTWTQLDNSGEHGDLCVDTSGNQVWVAASFSPGMDVGDGTLYYRRLDNGTAYSYAFSSSGVYSGIDWGMHFSGCNSNRPGWCVYTYEAGGGSSGSYRDGNIILLELTSTSPRVLRVAHHQSTSSTYWASPTACPNKDLTRIMFASDFRVSGGTPFEDYMIGLPSDWDTR